MFRPTTQLESSRFQSLMNDIVRRVGNDFPEWQENQGHDPSITVLQMLAFLAETLFSREGNVPEQARRQLWEIGCELQRLAGFRQAVTVDGKLWDLVSDLSQTHGEDSVYTLETDGAATIRFGDGVHGSRPPAGAKVAATYRGIGDIEEISVTAVWPFGQCLRVLAGLEEGAIRFRPLTDAAPTPIKRVRYFSGQMLSAGDFQAEQSYSLEKQKRHNRYMHSWGVVCGLEVTGGDGKVIVSSGMALDPEGNEIVVPAPVELALGTRSGDGYVSLRYSERDTDPVPLPDGLQNTRVEEGFELSLERRMEDYGVALARLVGAGEEWHLDAEFQPRRVTLCS
jgi:hypothetical protein